MAAEDVERLGEAVVVDQAGVDGEEAHQGNNVPERNESQIIILHKLYKS